MTLQKKIFIGYGVAVILLGLVIAWAVGHIIAISQTSDAIIHENHKSILAAENMIEALERQENAVLMAFLGSRESGLQQFRKNEVEFLKWLTRAKDNAHVPGESDVLKVIETRYSDYIHNFAKFIELANHGGQSFETREQLYQESIVPVADQIRDKCIELSNTNEEIMYTNNLHTNRMADRAVWSTAAIAAVGLLVVMIFSLIISRRITEPLHQLMTAAKQITNGNYAVSVPAKTKDELGRLATEFNQMAAKLDEYNQLNIGRIIAEKQKGDAILKNIADGLIVFDDVLKVTDINPAAGDILQRSSEKCLSKYCSEIIPDEKICQCLQSIAESGEAPEADEEESFIAIETSGGKKHYSCSITPIVDDAKAVTGIVMMLKDITWFKELEQLKTEFVMAASHELRTPLGSMGMSLGLLLDNASDKLDNRERELLQGANDELKRLKSMVNDLLDLSKIESGQIEMDLSPISIRSSVEHVKKAFQAHFENKGVKFEIEIPGDIPHVRADTDKITWVLTNLVSNALRYVSKNTGRIGIQGKFSERFVYISVIDNGPGIPEQYQSKIFQKFAQIEGYEPGGTGLGLSISREIIRAHGGTIWVESKHGAGAKFTFTLSTV